MSSSVIGRDSSSSTRQNAIELDAISRTVPPDGQVLTRVGSNVPIVAGEEPQEQLDSLSTFRLVIAIAALSGVNLFNSVSNGLIVVGLPTIAQDISLTESLLLWPSTTNTLATGSCLLLAGSIADVVGNRVVNIIGCLLTGCFILACGLAQTGIQLILFRAMQGLSISLCLPTSVAILTRITKTGRQRNLAFSCLGFVQPIGFSLGLVLEGVFIQTIGWRLAFYLSGALTLVLFVACLWSLPTDDVGVSDLRKLKTGVDWIGALIASMALAFFSYVLATLTSDTKNIIQPEKLTLLIISALLVPVFIFWQRRQERRQAAGLVPNSLWKNRVFTSICLIMILSFAVLNIMEQLCSLFFQQVQSLSALQASIRIIPNLIVGTSLQISTGFLIHKTPAYWLVLVSLIVSGISPLLMALIPIRQPYWYNAFWAQAFSPVSADILFTVGLLVVSEVFPPGKQAIAGAVFSTVTQFGSSLGLSITAVISASVIDKAQFKDKASPLALMTGYRASFWSAFAWMGLACLICVGSLRKIGNVGVKKD